MDLLVPASRDHRRQPARGKRLDAPRGMALHHLMRRPIGVRPAPLGACRTPARLGFERMLMFVTGVGNIRDVIPFARTPARRISEARPGRADAPTALPRLFRAHSFTTSLAGPARRHQHGSATSRSARDDPEDERVTKPLRKKASG